MSKWQHPECLCSGTSHSHIWEFVPFQESPLESPVKPSDSFWAFLLLNLPWKEWKIACVVLQHARPSAPVPGFGPVSQGQPKADARGGEEFEGLHEILTQVDSVSVLEPRRWPYGTWLKCPVFPRVTSDPVWTEKGLRLGCWNLRYIQESPVWAGAISNGHRATRPPELTPRIRHTRSKGKAKEGMPWSLIPQAKMSSCISSSHFCRLSAFEICTLWIHPTQYPCSLQSSGSPRIPRVLGWRWHSSSLQRRTTLPLGNRGPLPNHKGIFF